MQSVHKNAANKFARLGDVCEVRRGSPITRKQTIPGNIPVVAGGLSSPYSHNVANRAADTVTISGSGMNAGFVNFHKTPIYASDCTTVIPKQPEKLLPVFVYRFLQSQQPYIYKHLKRGAAQPHVYPKDIAELVIPVLPLAEQKRIVATLDNAFAGIATATVNVEKNIDNARELFEGELDRIFKSHEIDETPLGELCEFRRGLTYAKKDEVSISNNAVLRANNITVDSGEINFDDVRFIKEEIKIPEIKKVSPGSLLICTASGSKSHLGKVGLIEDDINYAFGGFMGLLVPCSRVLPKYLFWLTRSRVYREFIDALADGTNINNLKWSQLAEFAISLPPISEQKRIVAKFDKTAAATKSLVGLYGREVGALTELKQSLLREAFSGKLNA